MASSREKSDTRDDRVNGQRRLCILACWDYARPSWVIPLEGLVERGHEVVYLAYRTAEDEPDPCGLPAERPRRYWRDFTSGQHLLDEVQPDCVLVMGTEGAWTISTIFAARRRGIPTAVLQHGVFGPVEAYWSSTDRIRAVVDAGPRDRIPALRFLARSLASRPAELARAARYLFAASRLTHFVAAPKHPLASRRADRYLVASERAGDFHRSMDHVDDAAIRVVGLPEFDELLRADLPRPHEGRAVLIDTPHTGTPHASASITPENKVAGLHRLANDLSMHGWHLTVKLHPASYGDGWAVNSDALNFVRDADLIELLREADVVLGFTSTLVAAAMRHRPTVLLGGPTSDHAWLGMLAVETGAVDSIIDWRMVGSADVRRAERNESRSHPGRERFVQQTLGPLDGRALDRLEDALLELAHER